MLTRRGRQPGNWWSATALLIGTTIGAGIFGLPYVISRAGYGLGLGYLLGLGGIVLCVNLAFGEVVLSTTSQHQLPAYAAKYLGPGWQKVALVSLFVGLYGALTAYLLEVGNLLFILLHPILGGSAIHYSLAFFVAMSLALYFGLRAITVIEKSIGIGVLLLIGLLVVVGISRIQPTHFTWFESNGAFLPYGVVLFALASASAIPDMSKILVGQRRQLRSAIIVGTVIPIVVYCVFVTIVLGVIGGAVTENVVSSLATVFGPGALLAGALFGVFAMSTTFLSLGLALQEVWELDLQQPRRLANILVLLPPLVIVLLGWLSFIQILGLSGALIGGLDGIVIMTIHRRLQRQRQRQPEYRFSQAPWLHVIVYMAFGLGIIYELYTVVHKFFGA